MNPVQSADEVFEAIQDVKARAGVAFSTNFFPARSKIANWIEHKELLTDRGQSAAFFFRKDRDFLHLYFVAESASVMETEIASLPAFREGKIALDLVGSESAIAVSEQVFSKAGFRPYATLVRLARIAGPGSPAKVASETPTAEVAPVNRGDAAEILGLLEAFFDPYADQIPFLYEIESAIEAGQIIAIKRQGRIAAFIHFETQGVTSTIRYWMVAEEFREQGLGGTILRHYFALHRNVRRFTLWVNAANENALRKYERFGYAPDGLADHVLVKQQITA